MSTSQIEIKTIFIGNLSKRFTGEIYALKNYSEFYNELHGLCRRVQVFAGTLKEWQLGYEFSNDVQLNKNIIPVLLPGNAPDTPFLAFIFNNLRIYFRLIYYCRNKNHYFIFLPSPMGLFGVLTTLIYQKKKSLGIYVGGHYEQEQKYEVRKSKFKKFMKDRLSHSIEKLVRYSISKSDYVITSSYKYYYEHKDRGNIYLTAPSINVDEFDLSNTGQEVLIEENKRSHVLTFCGELRHAKGVIDLLNAFILLISDKQNRNYTLKIIGSGQALPELINIVYQNKIENKVYFCGQIKDKEQLKKELKNSTIFILPSYSEGFPRVAYECFTLGIPTILSPVGGIPYLVEDNIHCLFVKPGDIYDIKKKIETLISNRDLRARIIKNAKDVMVKNIFPRIRKEGSLAQMVVSMAEKYER